MAGDSTYSDTVRVFQEWDLSLLELTAVMSLVSHCTSTSFRAFGVL